MIDLFEFIKSNRSFSKLAVNDIMFVEYTCPISDEVQDIWSRYNYIAYIHSGRKTWSHLDHKETVNSGRAILVRKGVTQVIQDFSDEFCVLLFFFPDDLVIEYMNAKPVNDGLTDQPPDNAPFCSFTPDHALIAYFQSIASLFSGTKKPSAQLLNIKFRELFILLSEVEQFANVWQLLNSWTNQKQLRPLIEQLLFHPMSVDDFAALFHMSVSTFKRKFKHEFGTAPMQWIRTERVKHAAYLLRSTNRTIQEILYETGFSDPSHFNRTFKSIYKVSPLQYRNQLKN